MAKTIGYKKLDILNSALYAQARRVLKKDVSDSGRRTKWHINHVKEFLKAQPYEIKVFSLSINFQT